VVDFPAVCGGVGCLEWGFVRVSNLRFLWCGVVWLTARG
jgi:hypothetical protein